MLEKKVIDIIDIDMFVMFDDVMPIPISIIAVVFGGGLRVVDVLRRIVEYYGTCIGGCLADEAEDLRKLFAWQRKGREGTDILGKERL